MHPESDPAQLDLLRRPDGRAVLLTRSGFAVDLATPDCRGLPIEDLARSLAYQPRWAGATRAFYSVAEHSVMASGLVPAGDAFDALMHDLEEALTGDMPTPLKMLIGRSHLAARVRPLKAALSAAFGYRLDRPAVKRADLVCMATEIRDLLPPHWVDWPHLPPPAEAVIVPVGPEAAFERFMDRYHALRPPAADRTAGSRRAGPAGRRR